jgi:alkylation response protein AidB-like acyl-CoA dehydrogenase
MDFELSQEQKLLQSSMHDFVEKEIKPLAIQTDEQHEIPIELIRKMSAMGMLGSYLPEQYALLHPAGGRGSQSMRIQQCVNFCTHFAGM